MSIMAKREEWKSNSKQPGQGTSLIFNSQFLVEACALILLYRLSSIILITAIIWANMKCKHIFIMSLIKNFTFVVLRCRYRWSWEIEVVVFHEGSISTVDWIVVVYQSICFFLQWRKSMGTLSCWTHKKYLNVTNMMKEINYVFTTKLLE